MSDKNGSEGRIQWSRFFKKLSPYMIQKGLLYLKHYGPREFWIRLHERFEPEEIPYGPWYAAYVPDQTVLDKQRKKKFAYAPLISVVVPAYRTPELFLRQMIDSLEAQTYEDWELCIANGSPEDQSMRKVLEEYSSRDRTLANDPTTPMTATASLKVICITSPEKAFPRGAYTHASFPRLAGG